MNLIKLSAKNNVWLDIIEDIKQIEKFLGRDLGPESAIHREHHQLSGKILEKYYRNQNFSQLITLAGLLRRSLG